jgi:hypothetical protein
MQRRLDNDRAQHHIDLSLEGRAMVIALMHRPRELRESRTESRFTFARPKPHVRSEAVLRPPHSALPLGHCPGNMLGISITVEQ